VALFTTATLQNVSLALKIVRRAHQARTAQSAVQGTNWKTTPAWLVRVALFTTATLQNV